MLGEWLISSPHFIACFSIFSAPLRIKKGRMEKEKLQPCGLFHKFLQNAAFLRPVWRLLVSESLFPHLCSAWPPEKQEPRQNSAHKQFIRGNACGEVGEQDSVRLSQRGRRVGGWLEVCQQPHGPLGGLPRASAVSWPLLGEACGSWDLGKCSRCFWSPALVLVSHRSCHGGLSCLEHCPKCPLQYRLEQGLASGSLDGQCRPLAAFLMLDKQASYEQK